MIKFVRSNLLHFLGFFCNKVKVWTVFENDFSKLCETSLIECTDQDLVCNYPYNPNAAGLRWLELVKDEWNSSFSFDAVF